MSDDCNLDFPEPSDEDYRGEKDSSTWDDIDFDPNSDSNRMDVYYGERGSAEHGHIVFNDVESTADYLRDDEGEVYRDR